MSGQSNVFLDNYAKYQSSPLKESRKSHQTMGLTGNAEIDRLIKEREELMSLGLYTESDPMIQDIDR